MTTQLRFLEAVKAGSASRVASLLDETGASVNAPDETGAAALHLAAASSSVDVVRLHRPEKLL